jgi:type I restriction-modification system DNA methylase subunit
MLVEANKTMSEEDRQGAFLVGQDIDGTCVKMCALNMLFLNMNGYAIQGDSLALKNNYGFLQNSDAIKA